MKIHLIAVGQKMPQWVNQGYDEYARRLPNDCALVLHEIPAGKRGKNADVKRILEDEGKRIIEKIPKGAHVVALEVHGKAHTTEKLATRLDHWRHLGGDVALLVGGPEGLSDACRQLANEQWSLSNLTLPHPLVRVILAESLYRAWSVMNNHPYHRAD
jgi:23S rRNA (pseudouridine1915-N3)-methyltransferase